MTKQEELTKLLQDMDVPALRLNDMGWLNRNLGVRNRTHPNFHTAMQLIKELMRSK